MRTQEVATRTLMVKAEASSIAFQVAPGATVVGTDNQPILLAELEEGDPVTVGHTEAEGIAVAHHICKLDADARTLTVKGLLLSKTFTIDKDAVIVTGGKAKAMLSDLKLGDQVTVSFEDHDGVLIAHRIEAVAAAPGKKQSAPMKPESGTSLPREPAQPAY